MQPQAAQQHMAVSSVPSVPSVPLLPPLPPLTNKSVFMKPILPWALSSAAEDPVLEKCILKYYDAVKKESIASKSFRNGALVLGRSNECDMQITNSTVSRMHAIVAPLQKKTSGKPQFYVVDMQSNFGTFINEIRIPPLVPVPIQQDESIRLGRSSKVFTIEYDDKNPKNSLSLPLHNANVLPSATDKKAQVHAKHILIKHKNSRKPLSWRNNNITISKEDAIIELNKIRSIVLADPSLFEKIARERSDCSSHSRGGDLGFFDFGSMQAPFAKAAFDLPVDSISEVVETDSGVHLIKVVDIKWK